MTGLIFKILLSYLLGSVSGSMLIGALRKVDIRTMGSGNAGGTNAFRTQGLVFALGVILIDVGKAVIATALIAPASWLADSGSVGLESSMMLCGFAVLLGHCYPVFHGFKGGKGAATAVGALMVINSMLLIPMLISWLLILGLTGYVGLATVVAGYSLIPGAIYMGASEGLITFTVCIAVFMTFTHRANLQRLLNGNENRFDKARVSYWLRK
jgi:glycerol-3-phosphate acyltransferase PlsY